MSTFLSDITYPFLLGDFGALSGLSVSNSAGYIARWVGKTLYITIDENGDVFDLSVDLPSHSFSHTLGSIASRSARSSFSVDNLSISSLINDESSPYLNGLFSQIFWHPSNPHLLAVCDESEMHIISISLPLAQKGGFFSWLSLSSTEGYDNSGVSLKSYVPTVICTFSALSSVFSCGVALEEGVLLGQLDGHLICYGWNGQMLFDIELPKLLQDRGFRTYDNVGITTISASSSDFIVAGLSNGMALSFQICSRGRISLRPSSIAVILKNSDTSYDFDSVSVNADRYFDPETRALLNNSDENPIDTFVQSPCSVRSICTQFISQEIIQCPSDIRHMKDVLLKGLDNLGIPIVIPESMDEKDEHLIEVSKGSFHYVRSTYRVAILLSDGRLTIVTAIQRVSHPSNEVIDSNDNGRSHSHLTSINELSSRESSDSRNYYVSISPASFHGSSDLERQKILKSTFMVAFNDVTVPSICFPALFPGISVPLSSFSIKLVDNALVVAISQDFLRKNFDIPWKPTTSSTLEVQTINLSQSRIQTPFSSEAKGSVLIFSISSGSSSSISQNSGESVRLLHTTFELSDIIPLPSSISNRGICNFSDIIPLGGGRMTVCLPHLSPTVVDTYSIHCPATVSSSYLSIPGGLVVPFVRPSTAVPVPLDLAASTSVLRDFLGLPKLRNLRGNNSNGKSDKSSHLDAELDELDGFRKDLSADTVPTTENSAISSQFNFDNLEDIATVVTFAALGLHSPSLAVQLLDHYSAPKGGLLNPEKYRSTLVKHYHSIQSLSPSSRLRQSTVEHIPDFGDVLHWLSEQREGVNGALSAEHTRNSSFSAAFKDNLPGWLQTVAPFLTLPAESRRVLLPFRPRFAISSVSIGQNQSPTKKLSLSFVSSSLSHQSVGPVQNVSLLPSPSEGTGEGGKEKASAEVLIEVEYPDYMQLENSTNSSNSLFLTTAATQPQLVSRSPNGHFLAVTDGRSFAVHSTRRGRDRWSSCEHFFDVFSFVWIGDETLAVVHSEPLVEPSEEVLQYLKNERVASARNRRIPRPTFSQFDRSSSKANYILFSIFDFSVSRGEILRFNDCLCVQRIKIPPSHRVLHACTSASLSFPHSLEEMRNSCASSVTSTLSNNKDMLVAKATPILALMLEPRELHVSTDGNDVPGSVVLYFALVGASSVLKQKFTPVGLRMGSSPLFEGLKGGLQSLLYSPAIECINNERSEGNDGENSNKSGTNFFSLIPLARPADIEKLLNPLFALDPRDFLSIQNGENAGNKEKGSEKSKENLIPCLLGVFPIPQEVFSTRTAKLSSATLLDAFGSRNLYDSNSDGVAKNAFLTYQQRLLKSLNTNAVLSSVAQTVKLPPLLLQTSTREAFLWKPSLLCESESIPISFPPKHTGTDSLPSSTPSIQQSVEDKGLLLRLPPAHYIRVKASALLPRRPGLLDPFLLLCANGRESVLSPGSIGCPNDIKLSLSEKWNAYQLGVYLPPAFSGPFGALLPLDYSVVLDWLDRDDPRELSTPPNKDPVEDVPLENVLQDIERSTLSVVSGRQSAAVVHMRPSSALEARVRAQPLSAMQLQWMLDPPTHSLPTNETPLHTPYSNTPVHGDPNDVHHSIGSFAKETSEFPSVMDRTPFSESDSSILYNDSAVEGEVTQDSRRRFASLKCRMVAEPLAPLVFASIMKLLIRFELSPVSSTEGKQKRVLSPESPLTHAAKPSNDENMSTNSEIERCIGLLGLAAALGAADKRPHVYARVSLQRALQEAVERAAPPLTHEVTLQSPQMSTPLTSEPEQIWSDWRSLGTLKASLRPPYLASGSVELLSVMGDSLGLLLRSLGIHGSDLLQLREVLLSQEFSHSAMAAEYSNPSGGHRTGSSLGNTTRDGVSRGERGAVNAKQLKWFLQDARTSSETLFAKSTEPLLLPRGTGTLLRVLSPPLRATVVASAMRCSDHHVTSDVFRQFALLCDTSHECEDSLKGGEGRNGVVMLCKQLLESAMKEGQLVGSSVTWSFLLHSVSSLLTLIQEVDWHSANVEGRAASLRAQLMRQSFQSLAAVDPTLIQRSMNSLRVNELGKSSSAKLDDLDDEDELETIGELLRSFLGSVDLTNMMIDESEEGGSICERKEEILFTPLQEKSLIDCLHTGIELLLVLGLSPRLLCSLLVSSDKWVLEHSLESPLNLTNRRNRPGPGSVEGSLSPSGALTELSFEDTLAGSLDAPLQRFEVLAIRRVFLRQRLETVPGTPLHSFFYKQFDMNGRTQGGVVDGAKPLNSDNNSQGLGRGILGIFGSKNAESSSNVGSTSGVSELSIVESALTLTTGVTMYLRKILQLLIANHAEKDIENLILTRYSSYLPSNEAVGVFEADNTAKEAADAEELTLEDLEVKEDTSPLPIPNNNINTTEEKGGGSSWFWNMLGWSSLTPEPSTASSTSLSQPTKPENSDSHPASTMVAHVASDEISMRAAPTPPSDRSLSRLLRSIPSQFPALPEVLLTHPILRRLARSHLYIGVSMMRRLSFFSPQFKALLDLNQSTSHGNGPFLELQRSGTFTDAKGKKFTSIWGKERVTTQNREDANIPFSSFPLGYFKTPREVLPTRLMICNFDEPSISNSSKFQSPSIPLRSSQSHTPTNSENSRYSHLDAETVAKKVKDRAAHLHQDITAVMEATKAIFAHQTVLCRRLVADCESSLTIGGCEWLVNRVNGSSAQGVSPHLLESQLTNFMDRGMDVEIEFVRVVPVPLVAVLIASSKKGFLY